MDAYEQEQADKQMQARFDRDSLEDDLRATEQLATDERERRIAAEKERDEAVAHLYGIVEADKQDAQMGHPNPGDSCIGIYISLVLMEWLETRAK